MPKFNFPLLFMTLGAIGLAVPVHATDRFSINDLTYDGATRFLDVVAGESRLGYANGTFTVNPQNGSIFIVGHAQHQAIAEYKLNGFSNSTNIKDLPFAEPSLQPYSKILNRSTGGNPEKIDTITGLGLIDGVLVVNAAKFYDAGGTNQDTTLIINSPSNLEESEVKGFFELEGATHASGWMTPIPTALVDEFGSDYIFGFASNLPINSRNTIGPSAFLVDSRTVIARDASTDTIDTIPVLDYSLNHPLHEDPYNETGKNALWTELSKAFVGFIVPGTETYAVFGYSAGHEFGIGYKIQQDTGNVCGGPCTKIASDRYNYYWLWDVNDLLAVKRGQLQPHEALPYDYGKLNLPFQSSGTDRGPFVVTGADYDHQNNDLYLLLGEADKLQSQYESLPILLKYSINLGQRPDAPKNIRIE